MIRAVIALLLAATARAEWTNVWPAWQHPRAGFDHATQTYTATVERLTIYGRTVTQPPTPDPYRDERAMLVGCKYSISRTLATGGAWVNAEYIGSAALPTNAAAWSWNATNICAALGLPTNLWDYTPYRALSGAGGYTNDAAIIGHPQGETNAYTMQGGTNFPAGRSAWYTTDYGWDAVRLCLSNLVAVADRVPPDQTDVVSPDALNVYNYGTSNGAAATVDLAASYARDGADLDYASGVHLTNTRPGYVNLGSMARLVISGEGPLSNVTAFAETADGRINPGNDAPTTSMVYRLAWYARPVPYTVSAYKDQAQFAELGTGYSLDLYSRFAYSPVTNVNMTSPNYACSMTTNPLAVYSWPDIGTNDAPNRGFGIGDFILIREYQRGGAMGLHF